MRRRLVVFAVIGLVTPLGACGGSSTSSPALDTTAVQRAIARSIGNQHHVRAHVRCPAGVPRRAGVTFTCSAHLQVGRYPVTVTETNGSGHVRYGNTAPLVILDTPKVESSIRQSVLAQRHLSATVTCPAEVLQQAGLSFTCTASVGHRGYPFVVTETNGRGHVRYVGVR
jgi:hypothetical protein